MTAPVATELGIELHLLAGSWLSSAAQVIPRTIIGDYRHTDDALRLAERVDVITFDHEHVPAEVLTALQDAGVALHPGPQALRYAQDKLAMRAAVEDLELPNPQWRQVSTAAELTEFGDGVGWPVVLKTPRGGYDGKGVRVLHSAADVEATADWFARAAEEGTGLLAEEKVPFTRELSAQVARSATGEIRAYPVVQSDQRDGVCDLVTAPAPATEPDLLEQAAEIALTLAERLDVTGMLAVELFEISDGERRGVFVNELAMRPHNSGHWSMDGAVTGQFEQHLRAVLGLPLGETGLVTGDGGFTVMKNIFGGAVPQLHTALAEAMRLAPEAKVHLYGKAPRAGRKVGHVTIVGASPQASAAQSPAEAGAQALQQTPHQEIRTAQDRATELAHRLSEGGTP
ncbi:5-(carboxyamino)imidazole ribonucleotide synthase [Nesterenkonia aerolata]